MIRNKKNKPYAFVLGTGPNAIGVVRSLGREGVPVYAVGHEPGLTGTSRYCKTLISPNVENEENIFLEFLCDKNKVSGKKGVLFPTGDAYVAFVSKYRNQLESYFTFEMTDLNTMNKLLNKKTQYQLAESIGIKIPKSYYPKNMKDIEDIAEKMNYPVIIKGASTITWRKQYTVKKLFQSNTSQDLLKIFKEINKYNIDVIIQESILGPDNACYKLCAYMDENSNPLLVFTLQKIRNYPYHFGVGSVVESGYFPKVAELGLKYLKGIGYKGIGSVEFKRDQRDDQLKMIELNSRLWQQNSLASACGINFPYTMYRRLTGESVEMNKEFKEGIKWVSMRMDFASYMQYRGDGELMLLNWLKSLRGKKVYEVFAWDDPRPFFSAIGYGFFIFFKIFKKICKVIKG